MLCGEKILVCPVFDEGAEEVNARLPKSNTGFRLRGEGELIQGESEIKVTCTIRDLPVWFTEESYNR